MSSAQATNGQPLARVAKAAHCQNQACSFLSSAHLSIDIIHVPIRCEQAVAISYAWGDFDRNMVPVGHLRDDSSKVISIELGKEWVLSDFIDRLASLSSKSPIWLDQLCIPQRDEVVDQALASIPTIYRTFDVVALMPGRPCRCLGKFLEEWRAADSPEDSANVARRIGKYYQCLNFTAPSSWVLRLWTWHELMHSRRISCVWASETVPPCVPRTYRDEDVANLAPYFAALRESLLRQGDISEEEVGVALTTRMGKVDTYGITEMIAYDYPSMFVFHEFLGGKTLRNRSRISESIYDFMRGFELVMQGLDTAQGTRTASKSHHYVSSVWLDYGQYVMPSDFKELPFGGALQNALDQMGTNHNWNLLTTAPRGLFDSASQHRRSASWHPEHYFDSVEVQSLRNVYSPVFTYAPFFHSISGGRVPFRLARSNGRHLALSAEAIGYDVFVASMVECCGEDRQLAKQTMMSLLNTSVLKWAKLESSHIIQEYTSATMSHLCRELRGSWMWNIQDREAEGLRILQIRRTLLLTFIMATLHDDDESFKSILHRPVYNEASTMLREANWSLRDIKSPLYNMMTMALGLDMGVCLDRGVRIVVSGKGHSDMRLGFYRGDVDITTMKSRAKMHEVKSVKMNFHFDHKDHPKGGDLIYEAVKTSGANNPATFEVFGVWIPLHDKREGGWNAEVLQPVHTMREGQQEPAGFLF